MFSSGIYVSFKNTFFYRTPLVAASELNKQRNATLLRGEMNEIVKINLSCNSRHWDKKLRNIDV